MDIHKKTTLLLITILAILVGSYAILSISQPAVQTAGAPTQADPMPTQKQSSSTSASSAQVATVEYWFSPADLKGYLGPFDSPLHDFEENNVDGKARLSIHVIYGIDKDTVFLGGALDFMNNESFRRSVLLRSTDGGKHWTEVMQTTRVSGVEHIVFLGKGEGWALVPGEGEPGSIMPVMVWHTTNFGEAWEIAGRIKMASPGVFGRYVTLKFYSSTHGEVGYLCDAFNMCIGETNYYSILSTEDGGVTWAESYHLKLDQVEGDYLYEKRLAAFILPKGGRYGSHMGDCWGGKLQECPSYGQDGSMWRAEYSEDETNLFIHKRLPFETQEIIYKIPACIEYRQGKMMEPCENGQ